jgi:hypothetical protein
MSREDETRRLSRFGRADVSGCRARARSEQRVACQTPGEARQFGWMSPALSQKMAHYLR